MNSTIILTLAISLILFIVISSSLYDKPPNIQVSFNIVIPQNHTTSNETKIISTISLLLSPSPQPPLPQPPPEEQPVITAPPPRTIKKKTSVEKLEESLARARAAIKEAARTRNIRSEKEEGFVPSGPVYRHPEAFHRSHIEMMKTFKIWTYTEGDLPIFHGGPLNNIYGIEGRFILEMEGEMMSHVDSSRFRAKNPDEAHVFFLPFSVAKMVQFFYRPLVSYSRGPLYRVVLDYVNVVAERYPYWNRSRGADHFMVSCHDWKHPIFV